MAKRPPHNYATHTLNVPRKEFRQDRHPDLGRAPAAAVRRRAFSEFSAGHDRLRGDRQHS